MAMDEKTKMLTLTQAGALIGRDRTVLSRAARKGTLRAQVFGSVWLVSEDEIRRYERETRVGRKPSNAMRPSPPALTERPARQQARPKARAGDASEPIGRFENLPTVAQSIVQENDAPTLPLPSEEAVPEPAPMSKPRLRTAKAIPKASSRQDTHRRKGGTKSIFKGTRGGRYQLTQNGNVRRTSEGEIARWASEGIPISEIKVTTGKMREGVEDLARKEVERKRRAVDGNDTNSE